MPRTIRTGRGVTGEKHVRFNLFKESEAFLRVQRTTKDELDDLEKWAKAELRKLGLPDKPGLYRRDGDRWERLEKGERRTTKWRSLDRIVEILFSKHETAHLAARIVRDIPAVRSALVSPDKHLAEAARVAFRLGQWHERARVSDVWGRDAVHGARMWPIHQALAEASKEQHRKAEARKKLVRRDFERLRAKDLKKGEIIEQLAKTYGVAERTIRRDLQKK